MATYKGVGVIWGIGSLTLTGITAGSPMYQDYGIEQSADISYIKNASGDDAGAVISNIHRKFRITVIPSAASVADAKTNGVNWMPSPGTGITFSDTDMSYSTLAAFVVSSSLSRTSTGAAACTLELDSSVSVTTMGNTVT